ncbi:hypothetical protein Kfla_0283 [Kribbella flavida DSM 17836]|uniref:Uncharacterized protein n=1 Tax=Kribbella flavida (strain DSM 17836 / JCM 10339 / NBRC 14399) TaxID=479435 RepID=D2PT91_KRIFD|nr:hypothetical protein [Kribbella flavida]ADB29407.1 hypothetical protein Kfla_0283 [Kribbella flavida DSM 17836]
MEQLEADNPEVPGQPVEFRSLIADGEYVDEQGACWSMRGGELRWSRIQHLADDPEVRVVHVYLSEVQKVATGEREGLLAKVRPYLQGGVGLDEHTDFRVAEFKDDRHRSLLVVEESC